MLPPWGYSGTRGNRGEALPFYTSAALWSQRCSFYHCWTVGRVKKMQCLTQNLPRLTLRLSQFTHMPCSLLCLTHAVASWVCAVWWSKERQAGNLKEYVYSPQSACRTGQTKLNAGRKTGRVREKPRGHTQINRNTYLQSWIPHQVLTWNSCLQTSYRDHKVFSLSCS